MDFEIEMLSSTVMGIRMNFIPNKEWEQWVLLSSDRHFDNPKSKWNLQKKHLQQCKDRNGIICDFGDLFCAMQGKYDPRSRKGDIRPENDNDEYLDSLIDSGEKLFSPYAECFALIGKGNHESKLQSRLETNLTARLVKRLKKYNSKVVEGGYRGWIKFLFQRGDNGTRQSFNLYYTHGSNSNAPVTKGILRTARRGIIYPDADIIATGHIHESWAFPIYRDRITTQGKEFTDKQMHIQLPTYKEEFHDCTEGYHHENERPPKPLGAWWLRFFYDRESHRIKFETTQAE